ncbi:hypothetical protein [Iodidimonas nitroreducens]|nr:hypothetical protein [Iodidimonas nitroreducens]
MNTTIQPDKITRYDLSAFSPITKPWLCLEDCSILFSGDTI